MAFIIRHRLDQQYLPCGLSIRATSIAMVCSDMPQSPHYAYIEHSHALSRGHHRTPFPSRFHNQSTVRRTGHLLDYSPGGPTSDLLIGRDEEQQRPLSALFAGNIPERL
jgi:hypothetical protein